MSEGHHDPLTRALFVALVHRMGGVDAAAAILGARWGMGHKGTVSKMMAGQIGVTVDAMRALEDAAGAYPVTDMLAARMVSGHAAAGRIRELAAQASVAAGAAQSALFLSMADASDGGADITPREAAALVADLRALAGVVGQIIAAAEGLCAAAPRHPGVAALASRGAK